MTTTYTPAAGTVSARVVAWLHARPSGEYNASQIAEALNVDPKAIAPSLEMALRERLVFHRQRDRTSPRAPWWYSATDHGAVHRREFRPAPKEWMQPLVDAHADSAVDESAETHEPDTPQGDQAGSEPAREVMEPEACESAAGRGTNGAPALATLPLHASPGVGPMGAGQPADAGPTTDVPVFITEQPREVDAQFAASLRAAMNVDVDDDCLARGAEPGRKGDQLPPADLAATRRAVRAPHEPAPLAFRAARFTDGSLATERDGIVVAVYSAAEVDAIQKLLGVRG